MTRAVGDEVEPDGQIAGGRAPARPGRVAAELAIELEHRGAPERALLVAAQRSQAVLVQRRGLVAAARGALRRIAVPREHVPAGRRRVRVLVVVVDGGEEVAEALARRRSGSSRSGARVRASCRKWPYSWRTTIASEASAPRPPRSRCRRPPVEPSPFLALGSAGTESYPRRVGRARSGRTAGTGRCGSRPSRRGSSGSRC